MEYQLCHKLSKEFTINLKVNWKYIYIGYKGYKEITPQLSKEEITEIVKEVIKDTEATSIKDMGKVMKAAKEKMGASADGKTINEVVKELLA